MGKIVHARCPRGCAEQTISPTLRAEELDGFRKQRQKEYPSLTLTQMYNVLEKLRAKDVDGRNKFGHDDRKIALTPDEERIKDEGLILILKELHEKLDRLVFQAYGWPDTLNDEEILEKLVALNRERMAEERRGHVRWLRPDYQIPRFGKDVDKQAAKEEGAQIAADLGLPEPGARKPSFPTDPVAQTAAVARSRHDEGREKFRDSARRLGTRVHTTL